MAAFLWHRTSGVERTDCGEFCQLEDYLMPDSTRADEMATDRSDDARYQYTYCAGIALSYAFHHNQTHVINFTFKFLT